MGAMSLKVEGCAMFLKAVLVPKLFERDINVPPIPFDTKQYESKAPLKIGYYETDDYFEPCPSAKRGLREAIQKLKEAGHEMVPFKPPTDGWFAYRV
jgi:fatty acid amide hydrolase